MLVLRTEATRAEEFLLVALLIFVPVSLAGALGCAGSREASAAPLARDARRGGPAPSARAPIPAAIPASGGEPPALEAPPTEPAAPLAPAPPVQLADTPLWGASRLEGFLAALRRIESEGGLARVTHFGDSSIGLDQLSGMIRQLMQRRFGDGGAGFVFPDRHTGNYRNQRASPRVLSAWDHCFIVRGCQRDGRYGLGGVVFRNRTRSETAYRTRPMHHLELWYAQAPGAGSLLMRFGGRPPISVDTRGPRGTDGFLELPLEGETRFRLVSGQRTVRVYGLVLETEGPGLVWDTLSMTGAYTNRLLRFDAAQIAAHVARRDPDLLVFNYGGNDLRRLADGRVSLQGLETETREAIRLIRSGKPEASCLWMGVSDHRQSGISRIGHREVEPLVQMQKRVALSEGCAYYDTYGAMGGRGAFDRWLAQRLASTDLKHLTGAGRRVIARSLVEAILLAYEDQGEP